MDRNTTTRLPVAYSLAAAAILTWCPQSVLAADVASTTGPATATTSAPTATAGPKGHQMRRYQSFARQAELPPVRIMSVSTFAIGGGPRIHMCRLAQLPSHDLDALAAQFSVPTAVVAEVIKAALVSPAPTAAEFVQELDTAAIDYRFLQGEWSRYHPPQERQQPKDEALQALQAGDLAKAWALYDALGIPAAPGTARLQPPSNLRVVASH